MCQRVKHEDAYLSAFNPKTESFKTSKCPFSSARCIRNQESIKIVSSILIQNQNLYETKKDTN